MPQSAKQFHAIFISVFFLFAGFGLFLNSAGVRLAQMGVSNIAIGALNAAFFLGAAFSTVAGHRIVSHVGHIRSFSVFGALFAMASLAHVMFENLLGWGILRGLLGFCYFSMLMIVESWFAEQSTPVGRAKVLAIYNLVYYLAFTIGIGLLSLNLGSNNIFVLGTLLVMAAMLPVALTRLKAPPTPPRQSISIPHVLAIAPLAVVTSFIAGVLVNGFFTMASVFLLQQGFKLQQISSFLMASMVGGFLVQIPLARLSNRIGRRNTILFCALLSLTATLAISAAMFYGLATPMWHNLTAFVFGCGLFTLYALGVARANDRLPNMMSTVEVSRSLLFCYGLGSLTAPLLLGVVTEWAPHYGFYGFYALATALLAWFAFKQAPVPQEERSVFVSMPGDSGGLVAELDPRNEEEHRDFDLQEAEQHVENLTAEPEEIITENQTENQAADEPEQAVPENIAPEGLVVENPPPQETAETEEVITENPDDPFFSDDTTGKPPENP